MKKISKKLPTVTVAISAYNEGNNISSFLKSVIAQKEEGYILREIWVYSDGSRDETVKKAKKIKSNKIKIFEAKERLGKSSRLNQIYTNLETDYLVQSDADVIFSHPYVIRDIIKPLIEDGKVGMCGGEPRPVKGITFTEKAVNCTFEAYAPLRRKLRGGDNVFSVDGRLLAYRKELLKKIHVPEDTIANDAYTFFCCITLGYKYKYVPSAVVMFRSPQSVKDQLRQNTRFTAAPIRMGKLFPEEIVNREYFIPKYMLFKLMLGQFVKHPMLCTYIYLINVYCKSKAKKVERELNAKWSMALSTKGFN